jgi:hypothetical protein
MGFEHIDTVDDDVATATKNVADVAQSAPKQSTPTAVPTGAPHPAEKSSTGKSSAGGFAARAAQDLNFIDTEGFDNDQMGDFLSDSPHMSERPVYGDGDDEPIDGGGEKKSGGGLFSNIFAKTKHSPEELESKIGADLDGRGAKMAMMLSDTLFPAAISTLKDEESSAKYKADAEQKIELEAAWKNVLLAWNIRVTPGFYLAYIHGIIYGIPLLGGMAAYIQRVQLHGWHWPWSKKWKTQAQTFNDNMPGTRGPIVPPPAPAPVSTPAPQTPAPAPVQTPAPAQPVMEVVRERPSEPAAPAPAPRRQKRCMHTGKLFYEGEGFPKNSKSHPDLIDAFIDPSAWTAWRNTNGKMGVQSKTTK